MDNPAKRAGDTRPLALDRRGFLKLVGASAASAGLYSLAGAGGAEGQAPPVSVPIEELLVTTEALAGGVFDGVEWSGAGVGLSPGRATGFYTSPVLASKGPFTHIGTRWLADTPEALEFQARWSTSGVSWSPWEPVRIETHGRATAGQTYGLPVRVEQASLVQFRAVFNGNRGRPVLRSAAISLINAKEAAPSPRAEELPTTPGISAGGVYARELWGAVESLRFNDGSEIWPRMFVPVKKLVVHHTATTNDYSTIEEAKAEVRAVYAFHAVTLGWGDIGYNAIIDKWGNVYEGRVGRGSGRLREVLSADAVAGHAFDHNYGSLGIALLGTFTRPGEDNEPGVQPSEAMKAALVDVLAWQAARNNVDPEGISDFLLDTDEWNRGLRNIPGHRDCTPTLCPGGYVYDLLPSLRTLVAAKLARRSPAVRVLSNSGERATLNSLDKVQFNWDGDRSSANYLYLLEGWRHPERESDDVEYLAGFDGEARPAWQQTEVRSGNFVQLLSTFGGRDTRATKGHYTFHVMAVDQAGRTGYQQDHTLLVTSGADLVPAVNIRAPSDRASFGIAEAVRFEGSATDAEDGDLTYKIVWTSSRDGQIGTGGVFSRILGAGDHTVTSSVTDAGGATSSVKVNLRVGG